MGSKKVPTESTTPDAFDALPEKGKKPLPYNRQIEQAELARINDEKYGPVYVPLSQRMLSTSDVLRSGLRRLGLRIAIAEADKRRKG